ncbi:hypothetical protein [Mesorhizobium sp. SP-1A]|uniref:hypothetical protein n=1 Tax=Mesorhizobium sp. SP-1A TaxID=3077840 RepID=UPI0028F71FF0|nr:hypothetical protein [Mesorhizobium sp. SP-1A]
MEDPIGSNTLPTGKSELRESVANDQSLDSTAGLLGRRVQSAWKAIEHAYGNRLKPAELDYMVGRYVLGLTIPFHSRSDPGLHLGECRRLLDGIWSRDRVERALHKAPRETSDWVSQAFGKAQELGLKAGTGIRHSAECGADHPIHREGI